MMHNVLKAGLLAFFLTATSLALTGGAEAGNMGSDGKQSLSSGTTVVGDGNWGCRTCDFRNSPLLVGTVVPVPGAASSLVLPCGKVIRLD